MAATRFSLRSTRTAAFRSFPRHVCRVSSSIAAGNPSSHRRWGPYGDLSFGRELHRLQLDCGDRPGYRVPRKYAWEKSSFAPARFRAKGGGRGRRRRTSEGPRVQVNYPEVRGEKRTNIADKTPSRAAINCWRGGTITAAPAMESSCESVRWWPSLLRLLLLLLLLRRRRRRRRRQRRRSWVGCYSVPGSASEFLLVIKRSEPMRDAVICDPRLYLSFSVLMVAFEISGNWKESFW